MIKKACFASRRRVKCMYMLVHLESNLSLPFKKRNNLSIHITHLARRFLALH